MVKDLLIWQSFLDNHNGASIMIGESIEVLDLFTDASGRLGFGAYFEGHWTNAPWPTRILEEKSLEKDITYKELFPIVLSVLLWGHRLSNRRVTFHCDNEAVVFLINRQSTSHRRSMGLLRMLVYFCLTHNIVFKARHIPGKNNDIADALSRFQHSKFEALAPRADKFRTEIPVAIWKRLVAKLDD